MKLFRLFIFIVCVIILCVSLRLTVYNEPTVDTNPLVEEKFDKETTDDKEDKDIKENKETKKSTKKTTKKKSGKKLSYVLEDITKDDDRTANVKVDNSKGGVEPDKTPNPPKGTGSEGNADPTKGEVTNWEQYDPKTDTTNDTINPRLNDNLKDEVDKM